MNLHTSIGILRTLAILEGISYLLFAITMPLKYVYEIITPNLYVGMAHGVLFIFYVVSCLWCIYKYKWRFTTGFLALAASLIPFGTFVADARIFKPAQKASAS
jgi:integral membrane protein